ncbi:MAG: hypothetical protein ACKOEQ_10030, partial [Verrucomicrobiota bacterium]
MEERLGKAHRVWAMDRGMVSEANIALLRERKALDIVGTPKGQLRAYEAELAGKENWGEVQDGVEARLTVELAKADASLRRRLTMESGPVERRIGRWMGQHPAAARWMRAEVARDGTGDRAGAELPGAGG